jgi:hypothetical protein
VPVGAAQFMIELTPLFGVARRRETVTMIDLHILQI